MSVKSEFVLTLCMYDLDRVESRLYIDHNIMMILQILIVITLSKTLKGNK